MRRGPTPVSTDGRSESVSTSVVLVATSALVVPVIGIDIDAARSLPGPKSVILIQRSVYTTLTTVATIVAMAGLHQPLLISDVSKCCFRKKPPNGGTPAVERVNIARLKVLAG